MKQNETARNEIKLVLPPAIRVRFDKFTKDRGLTQSQSVNLLVSLFFGQAVDSHQSDNKPSS